MLRAWTVMQTIVATLAVSVADVALAQAPPQGTALRITLDADAVEIVRAMRRRDGLDPPDAAADARVARWLQRQRATHDPLPLPAPYPSPRRRP